MPAPFSSCWLQPWFQKMDPMPRSLYLYLALHPEISSVGVVIADASKFAAATGLPVLKTDALDDLEKAGAIVADAADESFLVTAYVSEMRPRSPAHVQRWSDDLNAIPAGPFRDAVIEALIPVAVRLSETQYARVHPDILRAVRAGR